MNRQQFEKFEDEFLEFENIPKEDRLSNIPDLCGLLYLAKLMPGMTGDIIAGADHDIYWLRCPSNLSDEDVCYLTRCGFHWSSEVDSLASFT